jgi:hypothetical protein
VTDSPAWLVPTGNMTTSTENFMAAVLVVFIALASSSV